MDAVAQNGSGDTSSSVAGTPLNSSDSRSATEIPATVLKATSRLVLVDAVVSDHAGKHVNALKPESFQVLEDGKPQSVRVFGFHHVSPSASPQRTRQLPPWVYSNIPSNAPNSNPPTVLLIDGLNTPLADQQYAHKEMLEFLKKLNPGNSVAVYLLGNSLRMIQDFTSDPDVLLKALAKVNAVSSPLLQDSSDISSQSTLPLASSQSLRTINLITESLRSFQSEVQGHTTDLRVTLTMQALTTIARNLAGYTGRKNLVWLSAAFPLDIGLDRGVSHAYSMPRSYEQVLRDAADQLTSAQVAVYPVDVRGLVTGSSAFEATFDSRRPTTAQEMADSIQNDYYAAMSTHDAMEELAQATGGRAYYNRNDIDQAVALSIADGSDYYTLGYYPSNQHWDGRFRKIEVKLVGVPQGHIRARRGYYATEIASAKDSRLQKHAEERFGDAMLLDAPQSTALPLLVKLSPPSSSMPLVVSFAVETQALSFENGADGLQHGIFRFSVQAYDAKRRPAGGISQTLTTNLKPETFQQILRSGMRLNQQVKLAPGKYMLKIGVLDERSGLMGTVDAVADFPAAATN